jgi:hypothetical protein
MVAAVIVARHASQLPVLNGPHDLDHVSVSPDHRAAPRRQTQTISLERRREISQGR